MSFAPSPHRTVAGLLEAYAAKALSPGAAVAEAFDRIAIGNPVLNAMTALCEARARAEALDSQERYKRGTNRPLEGIPFAVKDLIDCADVVTSYGSRLYHDHVPTTDAVAVARLREAGAILVGKTATHEFGWGITTTSALHGPTRNPLDIRRVPGGSSGGSAAAVAAGFVPIALGTDTAGSIRIPSAFCGIAGLKPSRDRVPLDGVFPLARSLDHVGPMAHGVADLRRVLAVLEGRLVPAPDSDVLTAPRIGIVPALAGDDIAPDIRTIFSGFLHGLARGGMHIATLAWPAGAPADPSAILATIMNAEARHLHADELKHYPDQASVYSPDVADRIALAEGYGFADYIAASQRRVRFAAAYADLFAHVDVIVSLVSSASPPEIGSEAVLLGSKRIAMRRAVMSHVAPQSLTGFPTCVIPIGRDGLGLPVGLQITGPLGDDHKVLAIADAWRGPHAVEAC